MGNRLRGDDQLGPRVVDELRKHFGARLDYAENRGDALQLLDDWVDYDQVFLIDAMQANDCEPGALRCWDGAAQALPTDNCLASSHAFGLSEAVELGRALGRLPPRLWVIGIQAQQFQHGDALSVAIAPIVDKVRRVIAAKLATAC